MFNIRQQHNDAFKDQATKTFEQAAVAHVREKLSEHVSDMSDQSLIEWVRDAMVRASSFGLITQQQIMCFLDSEVLLGKRFYERPEYKWALPVLRSDPLPADDRAGLLLATSCSFARKSPGLGA